MKDVSNISAAVLAELVRHREVSAMELAAHFLRLAENDSYNSYITVTAEEAVSSARRVDELIRIGEVDLPLAGVPVSVKDNICTAGVRTTCASRFLADFVPSYSATAYEKLLRAGAVPVGKVNLDEFAVGSDGSTSFFGKCTNPHDTERTPGGSSSGSATSVFAGSALMSLGSDTGGSARIPASYCGITALKPTYGSVSRYGLVGMAPSLEQICPMTKTVADNKLLFDVIKGFDRRDMTTYGCVGEYGTREKSTDARGLKVGVYLPEDAGEIAVKAVKNASRWLCDAGCVTCEIMLPCINDGLGVYYTLSSAEASSNLARFDGVRYGYRSASGDVSDTRAEGMGPKLRERLAEGAYVLTHANGSAYVRALEKRELIKKEMASLFEKVDVILTPATDYVAPKFNDSLPKTDRYAVYANLSGTPALTLNAKTDKNGLPLGVQLIGRHYDEDTLYTIAEIIEEGRCRA